MDANLDCFVARPPFPHLSHLYPESSASVLANLWNAAWTSKREDDEEDMNVAAWDDGGLLPVWGACETELLQVLGLAASPATLFLVVRTGHSTVPDEVFITSNAETSKPTSSIGSSVELVAWQ